MKIKDLFKKAVKRLEKAGIAEPELEISVLLAHQLSTDRTSLLLSGDRVLEPDQLALFESNISRRLAREPSAYIIEEKEFWSLPFKVTRDVLIPRPETELLIERVLTTLKNRERSLDEPQVERILDLGTGSGIIAIVLALELPSASVTGVDISYRALKVASHNAKKHKVAGRVSFVNSDWFDAISSKIKYDLVVANPPYIAKEILDRPFGGTGGSLQPEVGNYEPRLALDGGEQGLQSIANIAVRLDKVLHPGGWFFMEIGADQKVEVTEIFKKTGQFDDIIVFNDLAGLPRMFQARGLYNK